jgi:hypothetical protein
MPVMKKARRNSRRFLVLMVTKLVVASVIAVPLHAQWVDHVAGEVAFGPALATVGGGEDIERYPGFSLGICFNFHLLQYGVGTLGLTIPIMSTIGTRPGKTGADFQRVHIPIGVLLSVGDASGFEGAGSIGGSIACGYGAMLGAFTEGTVDVRPFISLDISIGVFKRGALKLRYSTVVGNYTYLGSAVNYHGLYLIGSSAW